MPTGFRRGRQREVFLVSITHLAFDRRLPVARKIAAYQKHRIKHLRRDGSTDAPAVYHWGPVVIAAESPGAIYKGVMPMARIALMLFALFLVTTTLPLGITYTL